MSDPTVFGYQFSVDELEKYFQKDGLLYSAQSDFVIDELRNLYTILREKEDHQLDDRTIEVYRSACHLAKEVERLHKSIQKFHSGHRYSECEFCASLAPKVH
jgi:hypothetical protein